MPVTEDVVMSCELSINRLHGAREGSIRIEAKNGRQILTRIYLPLEQFAEVITGKTVTASFAATLRERT